MPMTDDELPVLSDVIQSGDKTIIRSTRLQRVGIDRLDASATAPMHFELPAHLQIDHPDDDDEPDEIGELSQGPATAINPDFSADACNDESPEIKSAVRETANSDEMDQLIDEIIDNHIVALRSDLRALLDRARELP